MVKKTTAVKRVAPNKGVKRASEIPVRLQDKLFCERMLIHFDHVRAAKEAGFTGAHEGIRKKKRFLAYIDRLQRLKEGIIAKEMVFGQKEILAELQAIGSANPQDYVESYQEEVEGKTVTKYRQKPLMQLTRAQASAVWQISFEPNGTVSYKLPSPKIRTPALMAAGRHFGMFHDKLIQEHRHIHMQQMADLSGIQTKDLAEVEAKLISAVGHDKARQLLGITYEGEYTDVSKP